MMTTISFIILNEESSADRPSNLQWIKSVIGLTSYDKLADLRSFLYRKTISGHEILHGVPLQEIRMFLLSHGMSPYETEMELKSLIKTKNDLVFFEHKFESDKIILIYASK